MFGLDYSKDQGPGKLYKIRAAQAAVATTEAVSLVL